MKYSTYNYWQIKDAIKFYTENPQYESPYTGISVDQFINILHKNESKSSLCDKAFYKTLCNLRDNKDLLSNNTIQIVNKLMGDRKIIDKIRFINDGSFYSVRIWTPRTTDNTFSINVDIYNNDEIPKYVNKLEICDKIDWLYNHLEYIPVQIPINLNSRSKLLRYIKINRLELEEY